MKKFLMDLKRIWPLAVLVIAAFGLGFLLRGGGHGGGNYDAEPTQTEALKAERWTCSMHPQIILPSNDQKCPICFMDLIPLEDEPGAHLGPSDLSLSEAAVALAEIATEKVRREFVARDIRLVGKVSADETRTRTITARVSGRLDRLFVDATGQKVTRGMKLAEIYSPELYSAQAELQTAASALRSAESAGAATDGARANLKSAAERLRLWGMDDQQIQAVRDGDKISDNLIVRAPVGGVVVTRQATQGDYVKTGETLYTISDLSGVWVTLDAFESDVAWLREGQPVAFSARAYPGRDFQGDILFIDPVLDERDRRAADRGDDGIDHGHLSANLASALTHDVDGGDQCEQGDECDQEALGEVEHRLVGGIAEVEVLVVRPLDEGRHAHREQTDCEADQGEQPVKKDRLGAGQEVEADAERRHAQRADHRQQQPAAFERWSGICHRGIKNTGVGGGPGGSFRSIAGPARGREDTAGLGVAARSASVCRQVRSSTCTMRR